MKLHERVLITQKARNALESLLIDLEKEHSLTLVEQIGILNEITSGLVKYALRFERHGNYETPAGLAAEPRRG